MEFDITPATNEGRAPDRLRARAWLATVGAWGPTRQILALFAREDQTTLRAGIHRLVNRLCAPPHRSVFAVRWHTPSSLLRYALPIAGSVLAAEQFAAALDLASHLADEGIDPFNTLLNGVPTAAQNLTPDRHRASALPFRCGSSAQAVRSRHSGRLQRPSEGGQAAAAGPVPGRKLPLAAGRPGRIGERPPPAPRAAGGRGGPPRIATLKSTMDG